MATPRPFFTKPSRLILLSASAAQANTEARGIQPAEGKTDLGGDGRGSSKNELREHGNRASPTTAIRSTGDSNDEE